MDWIHDYQLFLFDFDGLLVNTEETHYLAYKLMCAQRGIDFNWDFARYCQAAHYDADALRNQVYQQFPQLHSIEPHWPVLYSEKKQALCNLVNEGAIHLMPGVAEFLGILQNAGIRRAVVTHSPQELVALIRKQNPILNTIETWITREQYSQPKPHPECYLKAIEMLAKPNDRVIGFEDTPRGLRALMGTRAQPVIICQVGYPEIPSFLESGALHFPSIASLLGRSTLA